jgi:hypothetical protein
VVGVAVSAGELAVDGTVLVETGEVSGEVVGAAGGDFVGLIHHLADFFHFGLLFELPV